jgi:uroporphyrinogen-III synthase
MRVLVTRPLEDGAETARELALRGHEALLAPLLVTRFFDGPGLALQGVQAILATSANGVRALARRTSNRELPVFAVGPQTTAEARRLGFVEVRNADGDAEALARATQDWARPENGALLHVAGEGNDGKLAARLPGFSVRREILYAVTAVDKMPDEAVAALRKGLVDAALFFSPRSAAVFRGLALAQGWALDGVSAAAISPATAAALAPLGFAALHVAPRPNLESLLNLLS